MTTQALDVRKKTLHDFFSREARQQEIARVLPKVGITAERITSVMFNAFSTTPKLLECDPTSLFKSLIQCASLGLEPNTALGQAYLIPFNNKKENRVDVQLIIGYKGFLGLARRSGELQSISSQCVYEGDVFEFELGTSEHLKHIPKGETDNKKITHAYAVAHFKSGGYAFEVMTKSQIDKIRSGSKAGNYGPWKDHYPQMARKTAIRRLMNYLPLSIEDIQRAVAIDGQNEAGKQDMREFTDVISAEFTEEAPQEEKASGLEQMADDAFNIKCPDNFDPQSMDDCDKCDKRKDCPAH
jgi:recombination protein RecT